MISKEQLKSIRKVAKLTSNLTIRKSIVATSLINKILVNIKIKTIREKNIAIKDNRTSNNNIDTYPS